MDGWMWKKWEEIPDHEYIVFISGVGKIISLLFLIIFE